MTRHSDPRVVNEDKLTPTQKRNKRVDKCKDDWALLHGIPLIRIWEKDIMETPQKVMEMLREKIGVQGKVMEKKKKMNQRHVNKLKK